MKFVKLHFLIIFILLIATSTRLYDLHHFPAGLNADEAAIGYNAYSLIKTGHDEHGAFFPLEFRSFDDYKPPLYFYIIMPFVALMGLNVWAIRLPSALFGIANVFLLYLLANQLFPKLKLKFLNTDLNLGHLSALILALSPWHLQFSRGGWEVNVATFFFTLGIYFSVKLLENPRYLLPTALSFVASLYTYHSIRIILPFYILTYAIVYFNKLKSIVVSITYQKQIFLSLIIAVLLLSPVLLQFIKGSASSRFAGVSIFADSGPYWQAIEYRNQHTPSDSIITRLLHNQYASYSFDYLKNYLSHFSPRFLFITGDEIARSRVPSMAQSYYFLAPFLFVGLLYLFYLSTTSSFLIFSWFLIAPIAAALTFQSPHALRSQNMVVPLSLITALGVFYLFKLVSQKLKPLFYPTIFAFLLLFSFATARYFHQYYHHYPYELPYAWEYGFEQLGSYLSEHQSQYDHIIVSNKYDQPYILVAFFTQYPPDQFQQQLQFSQRDTFGFSTGLAFGKYQFRHVDYYQDQSLDNTLLVTTDEDVPDEKKPVYVINNPDGKPVFKLYSTRSDL